MNRIKEITIVTPAYGKPIISFRDGMDIDLFYAGRQYRPSFRTLEILRKVAHRMDVDFDFLCGITTLRRRDNATDTKG